MKNKIIRVTSTVLLMLILCSAVSADNVTHTSTLSTSTISAAASTKNNVNKSGRRWNQSCLGAERSYIL